MRLYEIAGKKEKVHPNHDSSIPNATLFPKMSQYYDLYRAGIAMASLPGEPTPSSGPSGDTPFFVPYSQADHDMINKLTSFGPKTQLTHGKSKESETTHKVSPFNTNANKPRKPKVDVF
jgi:hypothetical protein